MRHDLTVPTLEIEQKLANDGADLVLGFDEVGRGSLAGPAMVGVAGFWSTSLSNLNVISDLQDSKLLTEKQRDLVAVAAQSWCDAYAIGEVSNTEIDEWGISYALGVAALRALALIEEKLQITSQSNIRISAILDGPFDYITKIVNTFDAPIVPVLARIHTKVKADRSCATVSAAAVIAKVYRDSLMVQLSQKPEYKHYAWDHNKGYGSQQHRNAIQEFGASDLHRLSWNL
ncbi:MAG: ribonuclease HII [Bifidobacteriaceae bacterium]|nr:ribonuclease HII [Bifidobacteriaceae bacterium]